MQRPRRPGDQAPPPRPAHRNDHLRTATTHVKDTSGVYFVHDGSPEQNVLAPDGKPLVNLTYEAAKRGKDLAVAKLKARKATIAPQTEQSDPAAAAALAATQDSFLSPDASLPDPQLEAQRQKAVAAAKVATREAQQRAALAKQRAPGWEPPPAGVSGANKPSVAKTQQRAPGWVDPANGKAPPEKPAIVGMDPLPDPGEGADVSGDPEVADLLVSTDLETDVKVETERATEAAKTLWEGLSASDKDRYSKVIVKCADDGFREIFYSELAGEGWKTTDQPIVDFETIEAAYHLLFGLPTQKAAT